MVLYSVQQVTLEDRYLTINLITKESPQEGKY
jgi:hypothetical protein